MSGTLRLRGATSGYSELQAPAVAADQTFVLPTAGGTLLTTDSPVPKLTLELGSASQPSLTFEGDTDTGLYSSGTNTLNLVTGGSDRLVINSSGSVGIGNNSPQTKLDVAGDAVIGTDNVGLVEFTGLGVPYFAVAADASNYRSTRINVVSSGGYADLSFDAMGTAAMTGLPSASSLAGNIMYLDASAQRVGIGTTSPGALLDLGTATPILRFSDTNTTGYHQIQSSNANFIINADPSNQTASSSISFNVDGSERMRVNSSGKLLIGETSFLSGLSSYAQAMVSGVEGGLIINSTDTAATSYCRLVFTPNGNTTGNEGLIRYNTNDFHMSFWTQGNERMRIDSSGNVGIGKSSNLFYRLTFQEGSGDASRIGWVSTSGNRKASIDCGNTAAIVFNTGTGDDERMRIDSSGFVLIGTTVSSSLSDRLLTVGQGSRAASYLEIRSSSTGDGGLLFSDGTSGNAGYRGQVVYSHSIDALQFWTAATERMRINSSGEFRHTPGGATSSTYMKSNVENTNEYVFKVFRDGAHSTAITFQTQISGAGAERMRIDSSGNLLVGKTASNFANAGVEIRGAGEITLTRAGDLLTTRRVTSEGVHISIRAIGGTVVGSVSSNGTNASFNTSSDYRLKENVVNITDGITRVKQLQPKRFNFIVDAETTVDGFLAHEAQTVVPEAVTGIKDEVDENGDPVMQGIDQSKLVPLLTAALQEAIAKIETLEQRLSDAGIA
mgnify:CR=1 FL=1